MIFSDLKDRKRGKSNFHTRLDASEPNTALFFRVGRKRPTSRLRFAPKEALLTFVLMALSHKLNVELPWKDLSVIRRFHVSL